jgi:hypothetical protein
LPVPRATRQSALQTFADVGINERQSSNRRFASTDRPILPAMPQSGMQDVQIPRGVCREADGWVLVYCCRRLIPIPREKYEAGGYLPPYDQLPTGPS